MLSDVVATAMTAIAPPSVHAYTTSIVNFEDDNVKYFARARAKVGAKFISMLIQYKMT